MKYEHEETAYQEILDKMGESLTLKKLAKIGLCRKWSAEVMQIIRELNEAGANIAFEAREVTIEPGLDHTFIRLSVNGLEPWVYDGVGTMKHEPYFGPEANSKHLANSKPDLLNAYEL